MKRIFLGLFLMLSSCASISRQDLNTIKNLTELKPMVLMLYEDFKESSYPSEQVRQVKLKIEQAEAYEEAKGESNKLTFDQFGKLKTEILYVAIENRKRKQWNDSVFNSFAQKFTGAIDEMIATERKKNQL
jgi:hypothetical protein